MTNLGTLLYSKLFGKLIGQDEFGNKYYISKSKNFNKKNKRFVIYNGKDEASKIPPVWHSWLHYQIDEFPTIKENYQWQKEHKPNLTGTSFAYFPPGDSRSSKNGRSKATGDYQSWEPK